MGSLVIQNGAIIKSIKSSCSTIHKYKSKKIFDIMNILPFY